ncbi:MAG: DUF1565 domain-containing protein, partial [Phycisphaerales bacterium]
MGNRTHIETCLSVSMFLVMMGCAAASGATIYVDIDAPGDDGVSWPTAYRHVQSALSAASSGDEIRVAQGTYGPLTASRSETIQLKNGVTIKGGYAGFGEPDPDARSITSHETILSGERTPWSSSYHVVTGSGTDSTAVLDGFRITGGNAFGSASTDGGGMHNVSGSPTVVNCTFNDNFGHRGGGMYNRESSPLLTNCTFSGNTALQHGGGMCNEHNSNPTLTDCTFSGNTAAEGMLGHREKGGGMYNLESSPLLTNCTFSANTSGGPDSWGGGGGGMCNEQNSNPTLTDCTFSDNSGKTGGAMYNIFSSPMLTNCTFSQNEAVGEMFSGQGNGGAIYNLESNPLLTNCTFSGNTSTVTDPWSGNNGGGGMYNVLSSPTLTNCAFNDNFANRGGGMHNEQNSSPTLTSCT